MSGACSQIPMDLFVRNTDRGNRARLWVEEQQVADQVDEFNPWHPEELRRMMNVVVTAQYCKGS